MRVARLAFTGLTGQAHDQRARFALSQRLQGSFRFTRIGKGRHARRAAAQFARCLRSAQQQLADDGALLRRELKYAELGVAEALLIHWNPAAESGLLEQQMLARQG